MSMQTGHSTTSATGKTSISVDAAKAVQLQQLSKISAATLSLLAAKVSKYEGLGKLDALEKKVVAASNFI